MNRQEVINWVGEQYGVQPDFPWRDWNAVLRHGDNNKWFGVIMEVGRDKLGLDGDGTIHVMNVKCDPALIGFLRNQPGFLPAYHMNKEQWLSIRLDGSAPEEQVKNLIDQSFELTRVKKKR